MLGSEWWFEVFVTKKVKIVFIRFAEKYVFV